MKSLQLLKKGRGLLDHFQERDSGPGSGRAQHSHTQRKGSRVDRPPPASAPDRASFVLTEAISSCCEEDTGPDANGVDGNGFSYSQSLQAKLGLGIQGLQPVCFQGGKLGHKRSRGSGAWQPSGGSAVPPTAQLLPLLVVSR